MKYARGHQQRLLDLLECPARLTGLRGFGSAGSTVVRWLGGIGDGSQTVVPRPPSTGITAPVT
jgi:hypothetical protein